MEFVWNEIQAEDIRTQSAAAMQGTTDDMQRQAQDFLEQVTAIEAQIADIEARIAEINALPPIMKTKTVTGERRSSSGELIEYTRTIRVVDEDAMAARQAQIEAMQRQIDAARKIIEKLRQAAEKLNAAAEELSRKIEATNALFLRMFNYAKETDAKFAEKLRGVKADIATYINKMEALRESFITKFTSGTEGFEDWSGIYFAMGVPTTFSDVGGFSISAGGSGNTDLLTQMMEGVLNDEVWGRIRDILNQPVTPFNHGSYSAVAFSFGRMGAPIDQQRFLRYLADRVDMPDVPITDSALQRPESVWTFCPVKVITIFEFMDERTDYLLGRLTEIGYGNRGYDRLDMERRQVMQNMALLSVVGSLTQEYTTSAVGNFDIIHAQRVILVDQERGIVDVGGRYVDPSPNYPGIRVISNDNGTVSLQFSTASRWVTGDTTAAMSANSVLLGHSHNHNFQVTNGLDPLVNFNTVTDNILGFSEARYGTPTNIIGMGFERAVSETIGAALSAAGKVGAALGAAYIPLSFLWSYNETEAQRQQSLANQEAHVEASRIAHMASHLKLNTVVVTEDGSANQLFFFWETSETQGVLQGQGRLGSRIGDIDISDIRQDPNGVYELFSNERRGE